MDYLVKKYKNLKIIWKIYYSHGKNIAVVHGEKTVEIEQIYRQFETSSKSFPSYFTLEDKGVVLDRILSAIEHIDEPTKRQEFGKKLYNFVKQKIESYKKEINSKSEGTDKLRKECGQLHHFSNRDFFDEILIPPPPQQVPDIGSIPPPPPQQVPDIGSIPPPPISTKSDVKANITEVTISEIQQARQMLERDTQEKVEERNGRNDD